MALTDYISDNYPQIKAQLSWSDSVDIVAIVDKTLELYGVATEGLATDLLKLHAIADYATLRRAEHDIALDYDFSADQASFSRGQQHDHIHELMLEAQARALRYLPDYRIRLKTDDSHDDWFA